MQVPFEPSPNVGMDSGPLAKQQSAATPEAFGSGLAAGLSDVGQTLERGGQMLAEHAAAFQQIDNRVEGDRKYTDYMNASNALMFGDGTADNPGYYNLKGQAAVAAYPVVRQKMMDLRDQIGQTASNPIVAQMFDADSRRLASYNLGDMSRHAATERQRYITDTRAATVDTLHNDIALNFRDPQRINNDLAAIQGMNAEQAAQEGWDPQKLAMQNSRDTSVALTNVIKQTANQDYNKALDLYHQYLPKLDAKAQLEMGTYFETQSRQYNAYNIAKSIVNGQPQVAPTDFAKAIMTKGERSPPGSVNATGHMGPYQFSEGTARIVAAEIGVPYDRDKLINNTDGYADNLANQYSKDLLDRYGNNATLAAAAWNAGPAIVDHWIKGETYKDSKGHTVSVKLGDPNNNETTNIDFASKIPYKETRDYVQRVTQGLDYGKGVIATNQDPRAHLEEFIDAADRAAGDNLRDKEAVKSNVVSYVNQIASQQNAQRVNAFNNLQSATMGGPQLNAPQPRSFNELMQTYPNARDDWARLSSEQQKSLQTSWNNNASGKSIPDSPESMQLMARYKGIAVNDPDAFRAMDFSNNAQLPYHDRVTLANMQNKKQPVVNENIAHAMAVNKVALDQAGIKKSGPDADPDAYNMFTGRMLAEIDGFIAVHGRRPSDSDLTKIGGMLLTEHAGTGSGWFGGNKLEYEIPYQSQVGGVPDEETRKIVAAHILKFGTVPSTGAIQYWHNMMKAKSRGGQ